MGSAIVVGYDGSEHAADALALGQLLAGLVGGELVVVCAYPDDPLGESATAVEIARGMRADAERTLARAREALGAAGAAADCRAIAGATPAHVLHDLAEQLDAAAIVVGATHHGAVLRLLTGSTPERVLDGAPCPVAVAPTGFAATRGMAGAGAGALRQIAVAFDGSPESTHALDVAAAFARAAGTGVRLRLVSAVNTVAVGMYPPLDPVAYEEIEQLARDEARAKLDAAIAGLRGSVSAEGAVLDGDPVEALVEDSAADDLLFTGSRGQGPFRRIVLGSVSTRLLREAACPVVIVPRGDG